MLLFVAILAASAGAEDWPHWRGKTRNDISAEDSRWQAGAWPPRIQAWKTNVGRGSTSPIVVGARLYTIGSRSGRDDVQCLDAATGKTIWRSSYKCPLYGRKSEGDKRLYAGVTSTPEFDGQTGSLFTLSIDGDLVCWDTKNNGKKIWAINLYDKYRVAKRPRVGRSGHRDYGYTSSPLVYKDWLIVEVGDDEGNLMAFDKRTGKRQWASQSKSPAGHNGGPVPITVEGVPCVAVHNHDGLLVARLDKGNEGKTVATYRWATEFANNITTVAVHENYVLLTSGYNHFQICKLKITLRGAKRLWLKDYVSKICTPIIHKGHVYWAWRKVTCLDFETGKLKWKGGRTGDPGSCILTADDRLIVWADEGDLLLVETAERSGDKYTELARLTGLFKTDAWPHVVLADSRLYCKDREGNLVCFDLRKTTSREKSEPLVRPSLPAQAKKRSAPASVKRTSSPKPVEFPLERPIKLKSWPGKVPGLILAWKKGIGTKLIGPAGTGAKSELRIEPRGSAKFDKQGQMNFSGGAMIVRGADASLLAACKKTNQLSIEAVITSSRSNQRGPARIITFSSDGYQRNFSLVQEGEQLIFRLRTVKTGENGMKPQTNLCRLETGKSRHVIVSYRNGQLACYLDGRQVLLSRAVRGDFSNWTDHHLLFGDEWQGKGTRQWAGHIERIAIHNRFIGPNEAKQRSSMALTRD